MVTHARRPASAAPRRPHGRIASKETRVRRDLARWLLWTCGLLALSSTACVTRGAPTSDKTLAELRELVETGPTPPSELGSSVKKNMDTLDYYLHASGRVRCGGFPKRQTVYVHTWTTHPGAGGERADVPSLKLRFQYQEGLFAGAELSTAQLSAEELSLHETITGVGDYCSCVYVVAKATLLNTTRLQVREKICPE
jgi:hypothetical protein